MCKTDEKSYQNSIKFHTFIACKATKQWVYF